MYFAVKHAHLTFVLLSVVFFYFRFYRLKVQNIQSNKFLKIAPHVIDTFLLVSAIALCVIIEQYPLQSHWLTVKVIMVVGYIGFAIAALKAERKAKSYSFLLAATLCLLMAGKIAVAKVVF